MKTIFRTYADTEVVSLGTYIECPYCGSKWMEVDCDECGHTYILNCEDCGEDFGMYFDAD